LTTSASLQADRRGPKAPPSPRGPALLLTLLAAAVLPACAPEPEPPDPAELIRPVRVATVDYGSAGQAVSLTGEVEAREDVSFAFRIGGRLIERPVNVGDEIAPGQLLARLEPDTWIDALRSARADLRAAQARLTETRAQYQRFRTLIADGHVTRAMFDQAQQAFLSAEAQVDAAQARADTAETQLGFTELHADSGGKVTARGAEPGEVVAAGQLIVRLARAGGRDAVFDVPARIRRAVHPDEEIRVTLNDDPSVQAMGRVREVAPQADPVTRTFRVRIGLIDPPAGMSLGSTVTGTTLIRGDRTLEVPASALTQADDQPAVWLFDPATGTVSLRPVRVVRYSLATAAVDNGLQAGDVVVTAGVQTLRPGQQVRLLGAPAMPEPAAAEPAPAPAMSVAEDATDDAAPPPAAADEDDQPEVGSGAAE
jgi:RND family efflux transporter MFP subunit